MVDHASPTAGDGSSNPGKTFEIGLSMSGAISAGAYTAGVVDYLIQALDELEKARARGDELPRHRVGIKVLSGASAGAITAAVTTIALASQQEPIHLTDDEIGALFEKPTAPSQKIKCYLPKLYTAWVVNPSLLPRLDENGRPAGLGFLDPCDLAPDERQAPPSPADMWDYSKLSSIAAPTGDGSKRILRSILNTAVLDETVHEVLAGTSGLSRSYIAEPLHIYMTLGNLRGVPYRISFAGTEYGMSTHGDRVHYCVRGLGTWFAPLSFFGEKDQKIELCKAELFDRASDWKWRDFAVFSLASSAFPIGLSPRLVALPGTDYDDRLFPLESLANLQLTYGAKLLQPAWPEKIIAGMGAPPVFRGQTVDGGVVNNDPFEYARFVLKTTIAAGQLTLLSPQNTRDVKGADRAVVMIAPFPEPPDTLAEGKPGTDILSIVSALIPA